MPDISITKTKEDAASKSLQVSVPVDRVKQAERRAVKYYGANARLPGFRPGKAPEAVVRRRFGEAIRQTMLEELIRESWDAAQKAESLKPIAEPHIHNLKFEDGHDLEFEFHVEVRPDVALKRTGGFKVERKVQPVSAEQVEERLRDLQERKASWLPVEGEKPSPGQMVRMEVAPLEGETAGASQPYTMVLGEGRAIPDVEEKVMTLVPGQTVDAEVRFPDDHPDESKRGTTRRVRITLHEVKRQELPPLDDAFAREIGDFETLDALRAALRKDLEHDAEHGADAAVRQDLLNQIYQTNDVPAPSSLVNRLIQGYMKAYEIPEDRFEQFAQEFRPVAEQQVRRELVLDAVVETNNLQATEKELDERVAALAAGRNLPVGQLYAQLEKAGRLRELERSITEEKAFAWLLQQSTVADA
ncbi:MAG TPA: trigger factor [Gemmatimonadales bacterium]|nr:trigger factor [Gemmatimonadales bacterium]